MLDQGTDHRREELNALDHDACWPEMKRNRIEDPLSAESTTGETGSFLRGLAVHARATYTFVMVLL